MSYYRMSVWTKKWTIQTLMHFTDPALANSWLLYLQDNTEHGTPRQGMMQFLEFRMTVVRHTWQSVTLMSNTYRERTHTFHNKAKKHQVSPVHHVSVQTTSAAHLPEMLNLKNPICCNKADLGNLMYDVWHVMCSYACKLNSTVMQYLTQANRCDRLFLYSISSRAMQQ